MSFDGSVTSVHVPFLFNKDNWETIESFRSWILAGVAISASSTVGSFVAVMGQSNADVE